jgi:hypothetical protein
MTTLAPKADAILRQFPGPVTLHPSPWKSVIVALMLVPLAVMSALLIRSGAPPFIFVIAVLLGVVGALGPFVMVAVLVTGANNLTLTAESLEFRNTLRGPVRWRWDQVSGFATIHVAHAWRVVYDDETKRGSRWGTQRLLPDTYRIGATNMAALLTAWRERALAARKLSADAPYGSSSVSQ